MAETKIPSIYRVPSNTEPELKRYLESVQEAVEVRLGRRGDELDQAVTYRDLIDSNLAQRASRLNRVVEPMTEDPTPSMPFNTIPQNVRASGSFTKIMVFWDDHQMGSLFARAEIWRASVNDLNAATMQSSVYGSVWTDNVDYNTTMYYWVRFVQRATSVSGDETFGQFSSPAASATTAQDIGAVMTALSEELSNLPGYATLNSSITNAVVIIQDTSAPTQRADGTALRAGDIWVDTDDNYQQYIRNTANNAWVKARDASLVTLVGSTSFTGSTLTAAMSSAQTSISTLTTDTSANTTSISNLNTTVNSKARVYRQDDAPSSGMSSGDLWIDTNDSNKFYQYDGSNWQVSRDGGLATSTQLNTVSSSASTAQATADSKTKTFNQGKTTDGIPGTSGGGSAGYANGASIVKAGDIWIDTDATTTILKGGTFNTSAVDTSADTIDVGSSIYNSLTTGDDLTYNNGGGTTLGGLTHDIRYFVVKVSSTTKIKLAATQANAVAASPDTINLTGTGNNAQKLTQSTTESNKIYVAQADGSDAITSGEWVSRDNSAISSAVSSVTQLSQTTADLAGNASASHVLQVNANGHVAGIALSSATNSSGQVSSNIIFQADKVFFTNSSGVTPQAAMVVQDNEVWINTARIKSAAIQGAQIGTAQIGNAHISDLNADKITTGTISASAVLKVGNSGDSAVSQRIQIDTVTGGARILIVDDSS